MIQFPNKILLSQDKGTREIRDYWVLQDFTDNVTKEYVRLDKVSDWIKQHLYDSEYLFSDNEGTWVDTDKVISGLKKAMEE